MTSSLCFYNPSVKLESTQTIYRLIAFGKFHKIRKFENHVTRYHITMMSLQKQWENADLRETSQIIYHSKGLDESYPKMQVLSNWSKFVKSYEHLSEILAFLPQTLTKYR